MKEYIPTAEDIAELNLAAEKITDDVLKSAPLCKIAKATTFYKKLSKDNGPDCVDMTLEGISKKGKILTNRIYKACDYTHKKPANLS